MRSLCGTMVRLSHSASAILISRRRSSKPAPSLMWHRSPPAVPMRFFLYLLPAVLFLLVYARFIYAGYHYFFSRHPIEAAAGHELRTGALFDLQKVGEALKTNPEHLFNPPPLHETLNKLRRGKAFREQTELDADIAEVMMRRDRARAQQHEAEAELRTIKKKLPWWRRFSGGEALMADEKLPARQPNVPLEQPPTGGSILAGSRALSDPGSIPERLLITQSKLKRTASIWKRWIGWLKRSKRKSVR